MTVNRQHFLSAIEPCAKVSGGKATILTHLLLDPGEKLTVRGSDGNIFVSRTISYEGILSESICLSASVLRNFVSTSSGEDVEIEIQGSAAILTCGKAKSKLPFLEGQDYPTIECKGDPWMLTFLSGDLPKLKALLVATSDDTIVRPVLGCIGVFPEGDRIAAVTTDTLFCLKWLLSGTGTGKTNLSRKFVEALPLAFGDEIVIGVYDNCHECHTDDGSVVCPLVFGDYPNVNHVFPCDTSVSIRPEKAALSAALKASRDAQEANRVIVSTQGNELSVWAKGAAGEYEASLPCVSSQDFKFAMNYKNLLATLAACPGEAELRGTVSLRPIEVISLEDESFRAVLMPMALDR